MTAKRRTPTNVITLQYPQLPWIGLKHITKTTALKLCHQFLKTRKHKWTPENLKAVEMEYRSHLQYYLQ